MAFTGNFMATSFKQEILQGVHNFTASTGNTFKLALYDQQRFVYGCHDGVHRDQRGCVTPVRTRQAAAH
jgi:hypothetical protein